MTPIDDEDFTLTLLRTKGFFEIIHFCFQVRGDIHPPLSYMFYDLVWNVWPALFPLRMLAWGFTVGAVLIWHRLFMERLGDSSLSARMLGIALFSTFPLLFSVGVMIRWYPPLAFFAALSIWGLFHFRRMWLCGIPLGLAISTNFLAFLLLATFPLQVLFARRTWRRGDVWKFVLCIMVTGSLGLYTMLQVVLKQDSALQSQFGWKVIQPWGVNLLGFFGGYSLGISQSWIVLLFLPLMVFLLLPGGSEDSSRLRRLRRVGLFLICLFFGLSFLGFAKPRSFLLLAPIFSGLWLVGTMTLIRKQRETLLILAGVLFVVLPISVAANLKSNQTPFKRTLGIPYDHLFAFIERNAQGKTLVVSSDYPVLTHYQLFHPGLLDTVHTESSRLFEEKLKAYQTIILVESFSHQVTNWYFKSQDWSRFRKAIEDGREEKAMMEFGLDKDAEMKRRMTGESLGEGILIVRLFK